MWSKRIRPVCLLGAFLSGGAIHAASPSDPLGLGALRTLNSKLLGTGVHVAQPEAGDPTWEVNGETYSMAFNTGPAPDVLLAQPEFSRARGFQGRLVGEPNELYILEGARNALLNDWTPILTNRADARGALEFSEPFTGVTSKVYRSRLAP